MGGDKTTLLPQFKILLLGNNGVGKSCIIRRYYTGKYSDVPVTIGLDFISKIVNVDRKRIKMKFWDPSGLYHVRKCFVQTLYRGVHGIVFVYDVTDLATLNEIEDWMKECETHGIQLDSIPILLLGNKCDCKDEVAVPAETARSFAEDRGMMWHQTSAVLDSEFPNMDNIFLSFARILKFSKAVTGGDTIKMKEEPVPNMTKFCSGNDEKSAISVLQPSITRWR